MHNLSGSEINRFVVVYRSRTLVEVVIETKLFFELLLAFAYGQTMSIQSLSEKTV